MPLHEDHPFWCKDDWTTHLTNKMIKTRDKPDLTHARADIFNNYLLLENANETQRLKKHFISRKLSYVSVNVIILMVLLQHFKKEKYIIPLYLFFIYKYDKY
jgi:hypothetical protein